MLQYNLHRSVSASGVPREEEPDPLEREGGPCILVVDDMEGNREVVRRRLERGGFRVACAGSGPEALELLARESIALILLDVLMPGMDGYAVLEAISQRSGEALPPVIMLTSQSAPHEIERALALGAVDHVSKPFDFRVLNARIQRHLVLWRSRHRLRKQASELALSLEGYWTRQYLDPLTGLGNVRQLELALARCLARIRAGRASYTLCVVNVRDLPAINYTFGPSAGDEVLRRVAHLLIREFGEDAVLSRFRGDKFGIVLETGVEQSRAAVKHFCSLVSSEPLLSSGEELWISVDHGLVPLVQTDSSVASAIAQGEHACATDAQDRTVSGASGGGADETRTHLRWAMRLRSALAEDRLALYVQPIVGIHEARDSPRRFEVLVRMIDGDSVVSPGAFLAASERHGLSAQLDRWVVDHALEFLANSSAPLDRININLSGYSVSSREFSEYLIDRIQERAVDPTRLCFELTETAAVVNLPSAVQLIRSLKERGVSFALDDFGTGVSSFSYLRELPVDYLKIDGQFVRQISTSRLDQMIVRSICDIARSMGMVTVAEFVEKELDVVELERAGVDYLQGYLLGKPLPISDYL